MSEILDSHSPTDAPVGVVRHPLLPGHVPMAAMPDGRDAWQEPDGTWSHSVYRDNWPHRCHATAQECADCLAAQIAAVDSGVRIPLCHCGGTLDPDGVCPDC